MAVQTWTEVSKSNAGATGLPRSGGRIMFASARNDADYIYTPFTLLRVMLFLEYTAQRMVELLGLKLVKIDLL
jgi:hypothetical protein